MLVVGRRGAGKSTIARKLIPPGPNSFVYDFQAEYPAGYVDFFTASQAEAWEFVQGLENSSVIIEEASIWLGSRSSLKEEARSTLVSLRHKNVFMVMIFHQISQIPNELIGYADGIVQLKTTDAPKAVESKFKSEWPAVYEGFKKLNKMKDYSYIVHLR